jgi:outer membrane cobalamin receptor
MLYKYVNDGDGLPFTFADFYGKLSTGITFFKNTIDNLIVWKLGSFEVFRPFNTDAEISGKQLEFEYSLLDNFLTFGIFHTSLTPLNKNKNITTYNKIIPYKPLNSTKVKIGVIYSNLRFNLFYRAVGKRYVTEANTIEMPPYNLVDANLSWQTQLYKLTFLWKLSVTNITNENYQIIRNYPLPLREWRLGFTISY